LKPEGWRRGKGSYFADEVERPRKYFSTRGK
jgi:hypothetical protein